ncbi:class I tRNA ligase family protein, partial [Staphylococcus aureus]|uniref:class I tRNA ligase family protein n=1 Tax=Staphylococcus aureus TaxID=1280 RepID=UPI0039BDEB93
ADFAKITGGIKLSEWVQKNRTTFHPINQWIIERFEQAVQGTVSGYENFKLNESANEVYTFVWNEYCDWYIEFSKALLNEPKTKAETQGVLLYVLESMLKLAHPMIPFVTEEIYSQLPARPGNEKNSVLMMQEFPKSGFSKLS